MSELQFDLHAAGVLAPGIASLAQFRAVCTGASQYEPTPLELPPLSMLPAQERRRASQVVRLVLSCIAQALESSPFAPNTLRSVFATDEGTGEVCQQMLETLATTKQVSPLLFPNSVQNAPSGYFSIAWQNREPATVVSLGLESFAAGLLCAVTEAVACRQAVLMVAYDPAMTAPLDEVLPVNDPVATVWIISAGRDAPASALASSSSATLGSFSLTLEQPTAAGPSPWPHWLPQSLAGHSSARAFAALGLLEAQDGASQLFTFGAQMLRLRRTRGALA